MIPSTTSTSPEPKPRQLDLRPAAPAPPAPPAPARGVVAELAADASFRLLVKALLSLACLVILAHAFIAFLQLIDVAGRLFVAGACFGAALAGLMLWIGTGLGRAIAGRQMAPGMDMLARLKQKVLEKAGLAEKPPPKPAAEYGRHDSHPVNFTLGVPGRRTPKDEPPPAGLETETSGRTTTADAGA